MVKWFLHLSMFTILMVSISFSQATTSDLGKVEDMKNPVYGIGLSAGWASGIGVSFRVHLPSKSSLQVVMGIIKTSSKLSSCLGGEYQYDFTRNKSMRLFLDAAIGYYYKGVNSNEVSGPFRIGAGVGSEFHVQEAFHVTIAGLFVFFSDGRIIPLPQISAHYYFY